MAILINLIGVVLLGLIVWWFWMKKSGNEETAGQNAIEIIVDSGIYSPDTIKAKVGQAIKLKFIRKAESPCAKTVVFGDLGISQELPLNEPFEFEFTVDKAGEFPFTCEMGMYRGKLIVD